MYVCSVDDGNNNFPLGGIPSETTICNTSAFPPAVSKLNVSILIVTWEELRFDRLWEHKLCGGHACSCE